MKLTQPVLTQSLEDEFDLSVTKEAATPAAPGSMLQDVEEAKVDEDMHYTIQKE